MLESKGTHILKEKPAFLCSYSGVNTARGSSLLGSRPVCSMVHQLGIFHLV